ncbi:unnamed protein product [Merluccius merluccius]
MSHADTQRPSAAPPVEVAAPAPFPAARVTPPPSCRRSVTGHVVTLSEAGASADPPPPPLPGREAEPQTVQPGGRSNRHPAAAAAGASGTTNNKLRLR